jgi:hypothetical protein
VEELMRGFRTACMSGFGNGLHASYLDVWNPGLLTDPDVLALYRFEAGHLADDTKGLNDLTAVFGPSADTSQVREGKASCLFESVNKDYFKRADADLSAGFPLKNGGAVTAFTFLIWLRPMTLDANGRRIADKAAGMTNDGFEWVLFWSNPNYRIRFDMMTGSASNQVHTTNLAVDHWYHVACAYSHVPPLYEQKIRVYDLTADSAVTETKNITFSAVASPHLFTIGTRADPLENSSFMFNGQMDELIVAKRYMSDAGIDLIRQGKYKYP